ncbi:MAG: peptidoglycan DL-endopeptidase RipA [Pseudonocardiales bacterium]|jgi:cell wall-associated NlpC family hydrolase|nr:peptidoglycan DL-endopeptidase RipA [Pseudonocardiales bacterium]
MTATGPQRAGSRRVTAVLAGVVVAALALTVWVVIAALGAIDRAADRPPAEMMLRAVPATYQPAPQAAAVAQTLPQRIGDWTAQRGVRIARRALHWLNMPYSFGAGGADGPSYGVAVDYDSRHDNQVYGFDCSGLTMFAVGPWLRLHHDAAAQYTEVGSYHPAIDSLQPGDLVFWSSDGTIAGIGHVAIYLGDGQVVQAPHSGDVIRVTPIYEVEAGTMGATRPLT